MPQDLLSDQNFWNLVEAGLDFNGDWDNDGKKNLQDYCPQTSDGGNSLYWYDGCPAKDSDKDKVPDYRDACPFEGGKDEEDIYWDSGVSRYGLPWEVKPEGSLNGCLDIDHDGYPEAGGHDLCPGTTGPRYHVFYGCGFEQRQKKCRAKSLVVGTTGTYRMDCPILGQWETDRGGYVADWGEAEKEWVNFRLFDELTPAK